MSRNLKKPILDVDLHATHKNTTTIPYLAEVTIDRGGNYQLFDS